MASRSRVIKFNHIVNNAPVGLEDADKFWAQAQGQAKLILEEAQEQYDAAMIRDLVETVDGACDVDYLQTYMDELLEKAGVQLGCSKDTVAMNNDQKYTLVHDFAVQSAAALFEAGTKVFIDSTEYEGETYYVVKRTSDNKVMKLLKHVPPNIPSTIPVNTMKVLVLQNG